MQLPLPSDWQKHLAVEMQKSYFLDLQQALSVAYETRTIYPAPENIFRAFSLTPLTKIKVVILGQDPYHGPGQAQGLSFSVAKDMPLPPSLKNIYQEVSSDMNQDLPASGNLAGWAKQGVFLLNSTLTVEANEAASHQGWGWEQFTDEVIRTISREQLHVVFLLWGKFAQAKAQLVDESKHLILRAPHPSPLSAYRGFLGCRHFSQANEFLLKNHYTPINWSTG